jgi:hypothetical protein
MESNRKLLLGFVVGRELVTSSQLPYLIFKTTGRRTVYDLMMNGMIDEQTVLKRYKTFSCRVNQNMLATFDQLQ